MGNIDLNIIDETLLTGAWMVKNKVINKTAEHSLFSSIRLIEINNGIYRSVNGKTNTGALHVVREKEIIYNPQLRFFIEDKQVDSAIITRLLTDEEAGQIIYRLTLYFSNGLELLLQKAA